jgi:hypothetical protein
LLHIKISRKESKESRLYLRLIDTRGTPDLEQEKAELAQEALELMKIFGAILRKSE